MESDQNTVENNCDLLFAYGTLRRGYVNHQLLIGCELVDIARTVESFAMYVSQIPFVTSREKVHRIVGELYRMPSLRRLIRLDRLEGHPNYYERRLTLVELDAGVKVTAWCYFCDQPEGDLVPTGDFADVT